MRLACLAVAAAAILAACGEAPDETEAAAPVASNAAAEAARAEMRAEREAAEAGSGPDVETILAGLGEGYVGANLERGRRLFARCASCHTLSEGGMNRVGPNLHGLFGSTAGTKDGFPYSSALEEADFVWTAGELDQWLANPNTYLPGNRMMFAGYRDPEDRRDLIAYLAVETHAE